MNLIFNVHQNLSTTFAVYVDVRLFLDLGHEETLYSCQVSISSKLEELIFWVQFLHKLLQRTCSYKRREWKSSKKNI